MGTTVKAPEPRNYGQETRETLGAQVELAPALYQSEAQFRPKYAQLELDTMRQTMPGLMDLYAREIVPKLSQAEAGAMSYQRGSDLRDVEQYGKRATDAFRAANPQQAALMDEMNRQALSELQAGARLDPSLAREVSQGVRGAQSARGFGLGMNDANQEAMFRGLKAEQLRRNRQGFAGSVVGLNQTTGADPFMAILGRPSQAFNQAQGYGGQGMGMAGSSGPRLFNPESQYAGDIYNQGWQGQLAARTATASNKAALWGAGMSAVGNAL
jgi:hypothetical protein